MRRALLIAYYFPPIAATGAMRPLNFCRHLPSYGWTPIVLATDHASALPPQSMDQRLLEAVPAGMQVIRVGHPNPRGWLLQWRERLGGILGKQVQEGLLNNQQRPSEERRQGAGSSPSFLRFVCDALLEFPDPQYRWYFPALKAMARMPVQDRPDIIWATGGPWTSLILGKRLSEKWGIPFVADFRDPWVGGHAQYAFAFLRRREQVLEREVCAGAARVILNTDELRERFGAAYPEFKHKFVTLTNGYAAELETLYAGFRGEQRGQIFGNAGKSPLDVCHFGTVYGNRSPIFLFQAVQELVMEGALDASRLRLRFVGSWDVPDSECEQLAKSLEEKGMLRREPPVPHQQCLQEMAQSDILLILQQGYPLQIPAKIYEYIVAGRPLLVLGGEGATANLVQRHRLGLCCPNSVREIKRTLMSFLSDRMALASPASADTAQFSYRVLAGKLAEIFSGVRREGHSKTNS